MASAAPEIPVLARDQAFENLYRRYVKDVYHYALALLRNPADAEDVTQTTFMNAYRAFKRGEEIRKPQNWLIKIAHNVARTRYARASRRVKEVPLEDHVEQLAVPETERPDVEGVLRALGGLPFNQRAALVMRELDGQTYAEIADTLGVSVSAVETLIFRARRSLRLRASALRSLGSVPLPASLAQAFQGGALVAGGGAAVGGGLLAKVMIALVVGGVATGVGGGGGNTRPAVAAESDANVLVVPASFTPQPARATRAGELSTVTRAARAKHPRAVAHDTAPAARTALVKGVARTVRTAQAPSTAAPAGAPDAKAPVAPAPVPAVVQVVEQAAASAPSVPLPVEVPSPPALPIELPEPPPLPPLPTLP